MEKTANIECYSCVDGDPIGKIFNSSVCPEGWTIDENPCNNNRVNSGTYDLSGGEKVKLDKNLYNYKDVMNLLGDSMKFSEFQTKPQTSNSFFKLYNELFYDIPKYVHNNFIVKSEEYVGKPENPRNQEIEDLEQQIKLLNFEINQMDREHPYFTNGSILMHKDYNQAHVPGFGGIGTEGQIRGPKYYMHSGKKRRITDNYSIWSKIKNRFGLNLINDSDIIIFLYPGGLDAIADGPKISRVQDLFISSYEVNMYKP